MFEEWEFYAFLVPTIVLLVVSNIAGSAWLYSRLLLK